MKDLTSFIFSRNFNSITSYVNFYSTKLKTSLLKMTIESYEFRVCSSQKNLTFSKGKIFLIT